MKRSENGSDKDDTIRKVKFIFSIFVRLLILIISLFLITFGIEANKKPKGVYREQTIKMSTLNRGSTGISALRKLLDKTGFLTELITEEFPIVVNTNSLNHLVSSGKMEQSVIVICNPVYSESFIKRTNKIAEYGANIIIYTDNTAVINSFLGDSDLCIKKSETGTDRIYIKYDKYGLLKNLEYLVSSGVVRLDTAKCKGHIIIEDKTGGIAAEKSIGDGKIVLHILPDTITNDMIGRSDNIQSGYNFIKRYSNGRNVYFYEIIHGLHKRYNIFYFFSNPEYRVIVISLLLLIAASVLHGSLRYGQFVTDKKVDDNEVKYYTEHLANLISKKKFSDKIRKLLISTGNAVFGKDLQDDGKKDLRQIKQFFENDKNAGE